MDTRLLGSGDAPSCPRRQKELAAQAGQGSMGVSTFGTSPGSRQRQVWLAGHSRPAGARSGGQVLLQGRE